MGPAPRLEPLVHRVQSRLRRRPGSHRQPHHVPPARPAQPAAQQPAEAAQSPAALHQALQLRVLADAALDLRVGVGGVLHLLVAVPDDPPGVRQLHEELRLHRHLPGRHVRRDAGDADAGAAGGVGGVGRRFVAPGPAGAAGPAAEGVGLGQFREQVRVLTAGHLHQHRPGVHRLPGLRRAHQRRPGPLEAQVVQVFALDQGHAGGPLPVVLRAGDERPVGFPVRPPRFAGRPGQLAERVAGGDAAVVQGPPQLPHAGDLHVPHAVLPRQQGDAAAVRGRRQHLFDEVPRDVQQDPRRRRPAGPAALRFGGGCRIGVGGGVVGRLAALGGVGEHVGDPLEFVLQQDRQVRLPRPPLHPRHQPVPQGRGEFHRVDVSIGGGRLHGRLRLGGGRGVERRRQPRVRRLGPAQLLPAHRERHDAVDLRLRVPHAVGEDAQQCDLPPPGASTVSRSTARRWIDGGAADAAGARRNNAAAVAAAGWNGKRRMGDRRGMCGGRPHSRRDPLRRRADGARGHTRPACAAPGVTRDSPD